MNTHKQTIGDRNKNKKLTITCIKYLHCISCYQIEQLTLNGNVECK